MRQRLIDNPAMKEAERSYCELPFMAKIEGHLFRGQIDLLVQNKDGSWHVIDHKTGRFDGEKGKKRLEDHSFQMLVYQKAVTALVKTEVRTSFYLVDHEEMRAVDIDRVEEMFKQTLKRDDRSRCDLSCLKRFEVLFYFQCHKFPSFDQESGVVIYRHLFHSWGIQFMRRFSSSLSGSVIFPYLFAPPLHCSIKWEK